MLNTLPKEIFELIVKYIPIEGKYNELNLISLLTICPNIMTLKEMLHVHNVDTEPNTNLSPYKEGTSALYIHIREAIKILLGEIGEGILHPLCDENILLVNPRFDKYNKYNQCQHEMMETLRNCYCTISGDNFKSEKEKYSAWYMELLFIVSNVSNDSEEMEIALYHMDQFVKMRHNSDESFTLNNLLNPLPFAFTLYDIKLLFYNMMTISNYTDKYYKYNIEPAFLKINIKTVVLDFTTHITIISSFIENNIHDIDSLSNNLTEIINSLGNYYTLPTNNNIINHYCKFITKSYKCTRDILNILIQIVLLYKYKNDSLLKYLDIKPHALCKLMYCVKKNLTLAINI